MKRLVIAAAAAVLLLVPAAAADAKIVVGKSIAGVTLGDSMATVKRKLGAPDHAGGRQPVIWSYTARKLTVNFNRGKVTQLVTSNPHERTAGGLGPGSTLKAVAQAYGADACAVPQHCAVAIGRTSTQFDQGTGRRGRVQTVKIQKLLTLGEI